METKFAWLRQLLQQARRRWHCFRGRHEWVAVDRYMGHDVGMNKDRCKHCPATDEWLG